MIRVKEFQLVCKECGKKSPLFTVLMPVSVWELTTLDFDARGWSYNIHDYGDYDGGMEIRSSCPKCNAAVKE